MRAIQVSADVFQAIWSAREPGEDDEDAILRRLLGVKMAVTAERPAGRAWVDGPYGVSFQHGFEMHRRRKGKDYLAQVIDGQWEINGRKVVAKSINEVSKAVGADGENGWMGWNFRTPSGEVRKISELRDPERIIRRSSYSRLNKDVLDRLDLKL